MNLGLVPTLLLKDKFNINYLDLTVINSPMKTLKKKTDACKFVLRCLLVLSVYIRTENISKCVMLELVLEKEPASCKKNQDSLVSKSTEK